MEFFKLDNCRTELYQWDFNQKLIVLDDTITEIQFENNKFSRAIAVQVEELDGVRYCEIPNIMLEHAENIKAFAYIKTQESGYTKKSGEIKIIGRKRPNNFYNR